MTFFQFFTSQFQMKTISLDFNLFFLFFFGFFFDRFHSNYHHHGSGWNPPDTPPESVTNIPTSLNNNNNHSNGGNSHVSIGATNSLLAATTNTAIAYRDGQFFDQNCHLDTAGSPNGSLASASPPSVIGAHSVNHVSNYRPHMAYYQV